MAEAEKTPREYALSEVQQWMQGALTGRQPASFSNVPVSDLVNRSGRLSAVRHLGIYKMSYIARLRECMRSQFATLAYALGSELFDSFTDMYLESCPSESYTLNDLGKRFADFLQATRPDAHQEVKESWPDFMIELAAFEYALSAIFDEHADDAAQPASEATPDAMLRLAPVLHLFHHTYPVCQYYLAHAQKQEPELPFPAESYCAVVRHNYRLGLHVIKPAQHLFLSLLSEGNEIPAALVEVCRQYELTIADGAAMWREWRKNFIASGFFVDEEGDLR